MNIAENVDQGFAIMGIVPSVILANIVVGEIAKINILVKMNVGKIERFLMATGLKFKKNKEDLMTVEETIKQNLTAIGFSETQIDGVMYSCHGAVASNVLEGLPVKWNDAIEDTHEVFFAVITDRVQRIAKKWIETNCPGAWFKPALDRSALEVQI